MITKTGNKNSYRPITTDGKTAVVMWDYKPILDKNGNETTNGKWMVENFKVMPSLAKVKDMILSYYNSKIDEKILSGMEWNGMLVWLSSENQFNYKAAYDIAVQTNGKNLPVVFKFGTTNEPKYYEFKTIEELSDFYLKTVVYIQDTLVNGWKEKDAIQWIEYEKKLK
jgi:hypothetical protein